jgi:hypothetical protein
MRVELRFAARTLLLVALAGTAALTACGNAVETLLPEDNAGAGGTGGNSGSSGAIASAGSAGSSGGSGGVTPVTWQELSTTINGTCAKAMCHNGMQQPTLLAVPAAAQYTALTTHPRQRVRRRDQTGRARQVGRERDPEVGERRVHVQRRTVHDARRLHASSMSACGADHNHHELDPERCARPIVIRSALFGSSWAILEDQIAIARADRDLALTRLLNSRLGNVRMTGSTTDCGTGERSGGSVA